MKGWVMVSNEGHRTKERLAFWVEQGAAFTLKLPAK